MLTNVNIGVFEYRSPNDGDLRNIVYFSVNDATVACNQKMLPRYLGDILFRKNISDFDIVQNDFSSLVPSLIRDHVKPIDLREEYLQDLRSKI